MIVHTHNSVYLLLALGFLGIISLLIEFSSHLPYSNFPPFSSLGKTLDKNFYKLINFFPQPIQWLIIYYITFAGIPVFLFSICGLCSVKNLKYKENIKISFFLIFNSFNLLFATAIAWLFFEFARGL